MVIRQLEYSTELIDSATVKEDFITQWHALQCRTIDPNAYLSPWFQLPALEYLHGAKTLFLCVWEQLEHERKLIGLCVIKESKAVAKLPFAHFKVYKSKHSFLSGILLDKDHATEVVTQIAQYFSASRNKFVGLHFADIPEDCQQIALFKKIAAEFNGKWYEDYQVDRACLFAKEKTAGKEQYFSFSGRKKKGWRRNLRKLQELGQVEWRLLRGKSVTDESIERFLLLENMGWKGEVGSSLLSNQQEADFFRVMIKNFRESGELFFAELLLNQEIISSTCNLTSNRHGFAFKVAWDPSYKQYGPGILNEIELLKALDDGTIEFDFIDSGASPGSYLDDLWSNKTTLLTGYLVFGTKVTIAATLIDCIRKLKRTLSPKYWLGG